ncbi:hypothetical protein QOZ98_000075 [Planomicrobium stackebrandtii]|uniref:Aminoglycoside phosphotransferase n=1 Tax=Planomicrobium stackebrandtii TaxID=253160 RepID=A0ABU0GPG8_9BACL|nr:hypothetical protein [Planomicrobium stackebrandtii]MDQ0427250.1 hypothetical protein [Planomicrobium stackebrandtii]
MNRTKLEAALAHASVRDPIFLGEGAWHCAWKVQKAGGDFVLRIPKETLMGNRWRLTRLH